MECRRGAVCLCECCCKVTKVKLTLGVVEIFICSVFVVLVDFKMLKDTEM